MMNVEARIEKEELKSIESGEKIFTVNLETDEPNILIGQSGGNLQALQHIVKMLAYRRMRALSPPEEKEIDEEVMMKINLDINNYKNQKEDSLRELAKSMSNQVLYSKNSVALRPMSAYERRIIHLEIDKNKELATESLGDEPFRKVVIKIKEN